MDKGSERPWTPGPWRLELTPESGMIYAPEVPNDEQLFEIGFGPECRAEQIANVTLIAAVPELYEALERLADRMWMICTHRLDIKPEEIRELSNARAALSKALPKEEGGKV